MQCGSLNLLLLCIWSKMVINITQWGDLHKIIKWTLRMPVKLSYIHKQESHWVKLSVRVWHSEILQKVLGIQNSASNKPCNSKISWPSTASGLFCKWHCNMTRYPYIWKNLVHFLLYIWSRKTQRHALLLPAVNMLIFQFVNQWKLAFSELQYILTSLCKSS